MKLSNFIKGRDNNFNLIRIGAAFAVLITHSFTLAIGRSDADPLSHILGITLGEMAIDIFFITSGFLVTGSLLARQSTIHFIWARVLRILPALLIMLLLTVFGLGVFYTSLPLSAYLSDSSIYIYLLKCSTLITGVEFKLPGVFNGNPLNNMVNGSLWTLPFEVGMYISLLLIFVVVRLIKRDGSELFQRVIIVTLIVASALGIYFNFFHSDEGTIARLFFMFFSGATFYVLRNHIMLSRWLFRLLLIALVLSAFINKQAFFVLYVLTIAYILFYVAYIPSGRIRQYNQVGDYSYGIYIYAWPVQQAVAASVPGVPVLSMFLISASATFLLAMLSWHLLERRALGLKELYAGYTRRLISAGPSGYNLQALKEWLKPVPKAN